MNKKGFINKIIVMFLLSIVILNSYPNESYANANNLTFNNLNIEQGISQSTAEIIFQDSKGYIAINNVTNVTVKSSNDDGHYALVQGTFTNNDKESVDPTSFFSNHLKVMEKVGKATHDLVLVTTDIENELTPWGNQIKEGRKKVGLI